MDIEFLAPMHVVLPFHPVDEQGSLDISPMKVGQIVLVLGRINSLIGELQSAPPQVIVAFASPGNARSMGDDMIILAWLVDLLHRRADDVLSVAAVATGLTVEQMQAMLPDRMVAVVLAAIEVNADFFVRSAPMIRGLIGRPRMPWNARPPEATGGPTPASSSSPTATATTTS